MESKEKFMILDQWAAEAFLTALDAKEVNMLKLLLAGTKIHDWFLAQTVAQFAEEVKISGYGYAEAKATIHALNYNVHPPEMNRNWGLPTYCCEWQYAHFHNTFPNIKLRLDRIRDSLVRKGYLTNFFGRQRIFLEELNDHTMNSAYSWKTQSTIGELALRGMTTLYYIGLTKDPWCFPALNTHDGLALRYFVEDEEPVKQAAINAFRIPVTKDDLTLIVPLTFTLCVENFNAQGGRKETYRYAENLEQLEKLERHS